MRVRLFGPPALELDGVAIKLKTRRALALLAYLAVTAQHHGRDALVELLYPERERESALAGFRHTLSILRTEVGPQWLDVDRGTVSLVARKGLWVDVHEFRRAASAAREAAQARDPPSALEHLSTADRLARGEFLAGFLVRDSAPFDEWLRFEQENLRREQIAVLALLAGLRERRGEYAEAIDASRRWLWLDPLDEGAHRALIRVYAASGRRSEALRQYRRCRALLAKELGEEPEDETDQLRERILSRRLTPGRHRIAVTGSALPGKAGARRDLPSGQRAFLILGAGCSGSAIEKAVGASVGRLLEMEGGLVAAVFPSIHAATRAAVDLERELRPGVPAVLESGSAGPEPTELPGEAKRHALLLLDAAAPGQILCGRAAAESLSGASPDGTTVEFLGTHRLKDLGSAHAIYQVGYPDLPQEFPPLGTLDRRPNNLRTELVPMIGREEEMAVITGALAGEEAGILTLTGPGGSGKTKLALHAAARAVDAFPDGVFFVDLAPLREPGEVVPAIASTLGVVEGPGGELVRGSLVDALRGRNMLLVLDNFEHLMPAAVFLAELEQRCPRLKMLVTSREPLRLTGERVLAVQPFPLPEGSEASSELLACDAVRLFVDRACASRPDFALTEENAPLVAEICRAVDGLPLAIELAAARTRELPLPQLLEAARRPLALLRGGARDVPPRQRTLREEIEWSYRLLGDRQKLAFRRLSVFVGGCTIEGAAAVCLPEELPSTDEALEAVRSLVERNLLKPPPASGEPRYVFLETIRQYARERLEESSESPAVRRRFVEWFLGLAERAAPQLFGSRQASWFDSMDSEYRNLLEALRQCVELRLGEEGQRLAGAMGWYWFRRARAMDAVRWLTAFSLPGGAPVLRARVAFSLGLMRMWTGPQAAANTESGEHFAEAARLFREAGERRGLAVSLGWQLKWKEGRGEYDVPGARACAAAGRAAGDPWAASWCLICAGALLQGSRLLWGHPGSREEEHLVAEGLDLARRAGDPFLVCKALVHMGFLAEYRRDFASAVTWFMESLRVAREIDDQWSILESTTALAGGLFWAGRIPEARERYREALRRAMSLGVTAYVHPILGGLNWVSQREGRLRRAARLQAASSALGPIGEHAGAALAAHLKSVGLAGPGLEALETEYAIGRTMTLEEAVAYALSDQD